MNSDVAHVLVVDDSSTVRSAVTSKLLNIRVQVTEAADGLSAVQVLREKNVDLAIIDLNMPFFDGYDLLCFIRGHDRFKHLPALVLTSSDDQLSLSRALESGATAYLVKPLHWKAFGAHIEHLLHLHRSARGCAKYHNGIRLRT